MSVKRFIAADMRRALELVRQEVGPDAIILSSRRVKQGVEILTSVEDTKPTAAAKQTAVTSAQDNDVPMSSDDAWREQAQADEAINTHPALRSAHLSPESNPEQAFSNRLLSAGLSESDGYHAEASAREKTNSKGLASGKSHAELAEEIEMARERMMRSKRLQSFDDTPIAKLADTQQARSAKHQQPRLNERAEPVMNLRNTAVDEDDYDYSQAQSTSHSSAQQSQPASQERLAEQQQLHALQSELADMRLLLEDQLTRMANTPQLGSPILSGVMRRLKHMGITDELANRVINSLSKQRTVQEAWTQALAKLSQQLPTAKQDWVMNGGVFAFVGPTGVGKTTTIAKLAARYVLEHGPANVAIVTTDTYRIAAHDQLRALGRILNVQVKVVDDNQDLPVVLRSLKHCPLVLIDTAGFRLGDPQLKEQLQALNELEQVKPLLVMAANSQMQMMKATLHAHQSVGLSGCVLTKLDESATLGEAMSLLVNHKLPLFYTTDGQEIPQDIALAKGHKLVATAVAMMSSGMSSGMGSGAGGSVYSGMASTGDMANTAESMGQNALSQPDSSKHLYL